MGCGIKIYRTKQLGFSRVVQSQFRGPETSDHVLHSGDL
jgi:hypothetical protein